MPAVTDLSTELPHGGVLLDGSRRWWPDLRSVGRSHELLRLLSRRDVTVRYRQTVLGAIWIVAGPLVSAGLFSFVFGNVADLPSEGVPYFVFALAGLLGWNLFTGTVTKAAGALIGNSGLISKIYFPRLVLPLAALAGNFINLIISFGLFLVMLVLYDVPMTWRLVVFPAWLVLILALSLGIGLGLGGAAVSYRDINYLTPVFTSLLMYLSPVAYSTTAVPENLQTVYRLNPVTSLIDGCRWSLLGESSLSLGWAAYGAAFSLVALLVGLVIFTRLEWRYADVV